ncbi:WD40 repeat domain-containing protein [Williamsia phyllosphaerae]|uniref:Uncharacterized protein n=1 Tax=Williamsia phyllosphaerae TaxID=885042 RepID=A0ABQ1UWH1_9NOCA|nr:hypothetical protein [Williamsia phyllosphaerae]GGF26834.1 hypothetical protein GCM10007298_23510 [Williamsia phyllosphaerae]
MAGQTDTVARLAGAAVTVAACLVGCTTSDTAGPSDLSMSTGPLESPAFTDDASASTTGATRLLGSLAGREVYPVALSPDGTRVAAVVESLAGREVTPGVGYGAGSAVSRHGPTELWVWDARSGARVLTAPIPRPTAMAFTPDGSRVVTDDPHHRGALLRAWDITTGRLIATYARPGEGNPDGTDGGGPLGNTPATRSMFAVGPDGTQITTYAGNDFAGPPGEPYDGVRRIVRLWNAGTATIDHTLESITAARMAFPPALAYTPDGDTIVAGFTSPRSGAQTTSTTFAGVATWSASTGELLARTDIDKGSGTGQSTIRNVAVREGSPVAVGQTISPPAGPGQPAAGTTVWMYDTSRGRMTTLARSDGAGEDRFDTALGSDGTSIAVLTTRTVSTTGDQAPYQRQTLTTFDATAPRRSHDIALPDPRQCTTEFSTPGTTVEYSPDGTTFMIAGCGLALYDSADPTTGRTLQAATDAQRCNLGTTAQFSGDGTRIVGSGPCGIRLYDTATGRVIAATG